MDQRSMVHHASRKDRPSHHRHHHHHLLKNQQRTGRYSIPCSSQAPISPKTYLRKSSAKQSDLGSRRSSCDIIDSPRRTSSSDITDTSRRKGSSHITDRPSPPGSSRYLLSDATSLDLILESDDGISPPLSSLQPDYLQHSRPKDASALKSASLNYRLLSDFDCPSALVPNQRARSRRASLTDSPVLVSSPSAHSQGKVSNWPALVRSSSPDDESSPELSSNRHQVVELRVSIHCKGCEGKVRKHISKMEGVKSFSIDLETKKVTIIGDVTPLSVLTSVSKVKNAQFWPSPMTCSSSGALPTAT
ncbi:Heavy metal-associated domain, HMA [Dillenia turbinata]|uniref:Heavy metal-associated domain, HMA n=1 Tax=Dillenia turbinata TaxID=194707 RepID=A0AAN8VXE2_9MAGN